MPRKKSLNINELAASKFKTKLFKEKLKIINNMHIYINIYMHILFLNLLTLNNVGFWLTGVRFLDNKNGKNIEVCFLFLKNKFLVACLAAFSSLKVEEDLCLAL